MIFFSGSHGVPLCNTLSGSGVPLNRTLRNFGRIWRTSPIDMPEEERAKLWDCSSPVTGTLLISFHLFKCDLDILDLRCFMKAGGSMRKARSSIIYRI